MKTFKTIEEIFEAFNNLKVLIIGDVMIDSYIYGDINRISPEAPVPVVLVKHKEDRLGGAANVARNIHAMGAKPILCSVIGNDSKGDVYIRLMNEQSLPVDGIIRSKDRVTTVKTRVIGNKHQIARIDEEEEHEISKEERNQLISKVKSLIKAGDVNVIIFEDYDKGTISESLINQIVEEASKNNIPIAVDPKNKNFHAYKNITLFKPNIKELKEGLNMEVDKHTKEDLLRAGAILHEMNQIKMVMVTLSEAGVFMSNGETHEIFPAHIRNIEDVSGAGDTVISVAALSLALGLSPRMIGILSNLSGGLVCEKVGVVPIDKNQLLDEARSIVLDKSEF